MKLTLKQYLESLPKNKVIAVIIDACKICLDVKTFLTMEEDFLNFKIRSVYSNGTLEV